MPNQKTVLTKETAAELVKRVAEQKKRKSSQISFLKRLARRFEPGEFIPKRVKPISAGRISL